MPDPFAPDPNYEVHDEDAEFALKQVGEVLKRCVPEGYGFVLLMASYGHAGSTFYISNIDREDVINMMKEWIERQGNA